MNGVRRAEVAAQAISSRSSLGRCDGSLVRSFSIGPLKRGPVSQATGKRCGTVGGKKNGLSNAGKL